MSHLSIRLSQETIDLIKNYVMSVDKDAHVYIFGSRADSKKKGGDIDIFILSQLFHNENRRCLKFKLEDLLGEQKIDILFSKETTDPFIQHILKKAVEL